MEKKEAKGKGPDNEVRVTSSTFVRTYLAYIARLFDEKHEKVLIKAMGNAVPRAVSLAMLVRHRFKGLHQIVEISTTEFTEQERVRRVGLITITLSKKELDKNHIGYSAPLPDSEVTEYQPFVPGQPREAKAGETAEAPRRGFRSRGRGMRGGRFGGRGMRGGRGFGRGMRGGRGGFGGDYEEGYSYGGYSERPAGGYGERRGYGERPAGGFRGRGFGRGRGAPRGAPRDY